MRQAEALLLEARKLHIPTAPFEGNANDPDWLAAREVDRQRMAKAWALAEVIHDLMTRSTATAVLERRLDRLQEVNDRRLERERRRAKGGLYAGERRSFNIPTHVEATDESWLTIKKDVASQPWSTLGITIGRLVVAVADGHSGDVRAMVNRAQGAAAPATGRRARKFVRLVDIEPDQWRRFRALAVDSRVTTARLVGIVAEAAAQRIEEH